MRIEETTNGKFILVPVMDYDELKNFFPIASIVACVDGTLDNCHDLLYQLIDGRLYASRKRSAVSGDCDWWFFDNSVRRWHKLEDEDAPENFYT